VLGEFPDDDDYAAIPLDAVVTAQEREPNDKRGSHFGVDVARQGSDKTVITEIEGDTVQPPTRLIKASNTEVAGKIIRLVCESSKALSISIDATGVGAGVFDIVKEARDKGRIPKSVKLNEVYFGAACKSKTDKSRFSNVKAEIYWKTREALAESLALSDDPIYQQQLPDVRYKLDSKGRIVIESKDEYRSRTGRGSPDETESLALAVYGMTHFRSMSHGLVGPLSLTKSSTWRG